MNLSFIAAGSAFTEPACDGDSHCQEFNLQAHLGGNIQISLVSEHAYENIIQIRLTKVGR